MGAIRPDRTQGPDESGGLPMAEGHRSAEPLAPRRPAMGAGHVRRSPGLVDENQPVRIEVELAFEPGEPTAQDIGTVLFFGPGRLFFARHAVAAEEAPQAGVRRLHSARAQPVAKLHQGLVRRLGHELADQGPRAPPAPETGGRRPAAVEQRSPALAPARTSAPHWPRSPRSAPPPPGATSPRQPP